MADKDDTRSQIYFGEILQKCEGINRNSREAVRHFELAADQGGAEGIVAPGPCLMKGKGVSHDQKAAVVQFKSAVDLGLAEGSCWLAYCLKYDRGYFRNLIETSRLFKIAADAGYGLAANEFGSASERGLDMAKNIPQAVHDYQNSSNLACPEGMFILADMHQFGKHVQQNIQKTIQLYRLTGEVGVEKAFSALCELYRSGERILKPDLT
jgi:TPR repeat protein